MSNGLGSCIPPFCRLVDVRPLGPQALLPLCVERGWSVEEAEAPAPGL